MQPLTRVYLETGKTCVFAGALDWPGWCRRGKDEPAALQAFADYTDRYAAVAGPGFVPGDVVVVGRVRGTATTDFGAPDATGDWDAEELDGPEAQRLVGLLAASWQAFDAAVAAAPHVLRKGPRGGGRDRDAIAAHVREGERNYGRKLGVGIPPRTAWTEQRATLAGALLARAPGGVWSARYGIRRLCWHVLDHAWEIEDRST